MPRFGSFEVDFHKGELLKGGTRVRIQEQPLRVLEALLERPGELVTREELRDRLWASDTYVDFERSLNAVVAKLRQALGDSAEQPLYIETVAKKGYRFIAPMSPGEIPVAVVREAAQPKSKGRAALAFALAIAAVAGGWWVFGRSRAEPDLPVVRLDLDIGEEVSQPAISRDGSRIVFVTSGRLATRTLDNTTITPLAGTEGASRPFLSPDGKWVGFFADGRLKKVALAGGDPVTLWEAPFSGGGAWGEDGQIVAALTVNGGLSRIAATGGPPKALTDLSLERTGKMSHRSPQILPGGKGVLYVASIGNSTGELRVLPAKGGIEKKLVSDSPGGRYLPTGHLVFFRGGSLYGATFDLERFELGPTVPLAQKVGFDFFRGAHFDISESGTLVYRSAKGLVRSLAWLDNEGRKELLTLKPNIYFTPRISPDGRYLVLLMSADGQANVWGYEIAQKTLMRLTFDNEPKCCPIWTPDGKYITYTSGIGINVIPRDGSRKPEQLLGGTSAAAWTYSAKGDWLTFHRTDPQTSSDAWMAPIEWKPDGPRAGEAKALVQLPGLQSVPSISPDGRWLLYGSDESGRIELYVAPFSTNGLAKGVKWQVSNGEFYGSPIWSRNGREILYRGQDMRIRTVAFTTTNNAFAAGTPRVWSDQRLADVGIFPSFDVAPDGKRVVAVVDTEESRRDETHLRVVLSLGDELRRVAAARQEK